MNKEIKTCPTCHCEISGRWERLTKSLIESLKQFEAVSKGIARNLNSCGFTFSQRANFQKLAYWKLVERVGNGDWQITPSGLNFLEGFADVPLQVFKVKGKAEIERVSTERVHIEDVVKKGEGFKKDFERIKLKQNSLFL